MVPLPWSQPECLLALQMYIPSLLEVCAADKMQVSQFMLRVKYFCEITFIYVASNRRVGCCNWRGTSRDILCKCIQNTQLSSRQRTVVPPTVKWVASLRSVYRHWGLLTSGVALYLLRGFPITRVTSTVRLLQKLRQRLSSPRKGMYGKEWLLYIRGKDLS
jgi:hypothetical protein